MPITRYAPAMTASAAPPPALPTEATGADALAFTYKRAPVPIVRGDGVMLIDADGHAFLDLASGIAVNALGYNDAGIRSAIQAALESGLIHTSNLFRTEPGERLAAALVERSFADRVFFCNSGAEANEGAFKFARKWARTPDAPAKHEIISLRGAFHGRLFASVAATDRPGYRLPFRPLAGGITIAERDERELEAMLDAETVAAVIVEPIQGEGGVRIIDPSLLAFLREVTRDRRIALIFDEVQCGLGRTGHLFAYQRAGVVPDILTLAKPIAGGLPMGAILLTESVASALEPGEHGTTFGGGPFVASVALHVLDRLSDPALLTHVREVGAWMGERLHTMMERSAKVRAVRGAGFMWGIDVVDVAAEVVARARDAGILILSAGDHTLRLLPPLVMTQAQLGAALDVLEQVL